MLIWLTAYLTLEMIYLFVLCNLEDKDWKHTYEQFCKYCLRFSKNLPVELILGFYVTSVVGRWWDQFSLLPFSDELAMKVVNFLPNTVSKNCVCINNYVSYPLHYPHYVLNTPLIQMVTAVGVDIINQTNLL